MERIYFSKMNDSRKGGQEIYQENEVWKRCTVRYYSMLYTARKYVLYNIEILILMYKIKKRFPNYLLLSIASSEL